MNVEIMIYIYLFVCSSMIVFNIVTAFLFKHRAKKTVRTSESFRIKVGEQLEKIQNGEKCDDEHKKYMRKKLKKVGNMIAFDDMLEAAYVENPIAVKSYLTELNEVFISLNEVFSHKDRIETAYFPYIIKKYRILSGSSLPSIEETLIDLLDEPSLYCRENALQALYTTGNCDNVIRAIKKIDKSELFFHGKILSDGLLNFSGSAEKLIEQIISEFESFSDEMKVTLLNYFRFVSGKHCEFVFSLLSDKKRDDELRYSAIRYLGKYKFEKAYDLLCALAESDNAEKWRYAAIASSALACYPSENTVELLKSNLYSENWYVRFNSAKSLSSLGVGYAELSEVIDGNDRYASEILRYMLEKENVGERSVAV